MTPETAERYITEIAESDPAAILPTPEELAAGEEEGKTWDFILGQWEAAEEDEPIEIHRLIAQGRAILDEQEANVKAGEAAEERELAEELAEEWSGIIRELKGEIPAVLHAGIRIPVNPPRWHAAHEQYNQVEIEIPITGRPTLIAVRSHANGQAEAISWSYMAPAQHAYRDKAGRFELEEDDRDRFDDMPVFYDEIRPALAALQMRAERAIERLVEQEGRQREERTAQAAAQAAAAARRKRQRETVANIKYMASRGEAGMGIAYGIALLAEMILDGTEEEEGEK